MNEDVIVAWHDAVNGRDLAAARATVTDPVDVLGPRGAGPISAAAFAEWIVRSGIHLLPVARHPVGDGLVVVEQDATWPTGAEPASPPARVATVFEVRDGAISLIHRFSTLDEALRAAGGRLSGS